ncbi:cation:proton antiporter [Acuticoccus sp. M5D2P5]|nr:cation:proton antiporter [Acuticoccus kalidii]
MIVSFIAVGILAASLFERNEETVAQIDFLAELGIALLLFLVGLKLDWRLIRTLGGVSLATGLGQVIFTAAIGFLIGIALGLDTVTSLYVAVALTFSSTIIVVKLLSDKRELETLHGRIALGFLIVQDIVVVIAMVVLSTLGIGAEGAGLGDVVRVVAGMVGALLTLVVFVRFAAEPLMERFARTPELIVIFAMGWAAAAAATGDFVGFGKELGGLVAGVSLGSTSYRDMLSARLAPMRDFLLLFFFLSIGSMLDLSTLSGDIGRAAAFSIFVLVGNPLIVLAIMAAMGYRARTGFLAGLTVAQISEFSLIFMAMGLSLGHVDEAAVGLVTLVGVVTIALSVYMITYSHQLAEILGEALRRVDGIRRGAFSEHGSEEGPVYDVILFGLGRFGLQLYRRLEDEGYRVLAVDLDPRIVRGWSGRGIRVRYGDVTDHEFLSELPMVSARWVVLSVPTTAMRLTEADPVGSLLSALRENKFQGRMALTSRGDPGADHPGLASVDLVFHPFKDAAIAAVAAMTAADEERRGGEPSRTTAETDA